MAEKSIHPPNRENHIKFHRTFLCVEQARHISTRHLAATFPVHYDHAFLDAPVFVCVCDVRTVRVAIQHP